MEQNCFCEKNAATDLLMSEKHLAFVYNTFLLECATPEMISCLGELLMDTHSMAQQLFEEMNSRGWYPVPKAEESKVAGARQRFAEGITV